MKLIVAGCHRVCGNNFVNYDKMSHDMPNELANFPVWLWIDAVLGTK